MFEMTDRVALITGAASGIGAATARVFAAAGADVAVGRAFFSSGSTVDPICSICSRTCSAVMPGSCTRRLSASAPTSTTAAASRSATWRGSSDATVWSAPNACVPVA